MKKPHLEAQPAYESTHMVAMDLLGRIRELLQDQPAPDGDVEINWAHVGSLTEVANRLAAVVAFLKGNER